MHGVVSIIHDYLMRRLHRVKLALCYADVHDIFRLGWLPVKERQDYHLSKMLLLKALYASHWPENLK